MHLQFLTHLLLIGRYCCFFCRFRDKLGVKVVKALKRNDDGVTHAAIDMLCALMQVTFHYKTFHELHVLYLFWFCEFFCKLKPLILYLFGFKPILAISRDPELLTQKIYLINTNGKCIILGYKRRAIFGLEVSRRP